MSKPEKRPGGELEDLERMSTADLEALLLLDFQSQEAGESDMSGLFQVAEELAGREAARSTGTGADRAWEIFLEKYLPFAMGGSSLYEDAEPPSGSAAAVQPRPSPLPDPERRAQPRRMAHSFWRKAFRTAACLPLGIVSSGGVFLVFNSEAQAVFAGWVREFYKESFVYRHTSPAGTAEKEDLSYCPAWLPEGYSLSNAVNLGGGGITLLYEGEDGRGLVFHYFQASENGPAFYAAEPPRAVTVSGAPADLYPAPEKGFASALIWSDSKTGLLFTVIAALPEKDLIRVAESIRAGPPLEPPYCPNWVPEGCQEESKGVSGSSTSICYINSGGGLLRYLYAAANSGTYKTSREALEKETAGLKPQDALAGVRPARLYRKADGTGHLVWSDDAGNLFWLAGPLTGEELLRMAEGVSPGP